MVLSRFLSGLFTCLGLLFELELASWVETSTTGIIFSSGGVRSGSNFTSMNATTPWRKHANRIAVGKNEARTSEYVVF